MKCLVFYLVIFLVLSGCSGFAPGETPLTGAQVHTVSSNQVQPTQSTTALPNPPTPTATIIPTAKPTTSNPKLPIPTNLPYSAGPRFPAHNVNPLTGLPVENPERLNRRPIAIKVTLFPRSVRPQWGLSLADHVYEYYIADEMTRFIAIFYGNDASRVGPIRSARLFDEHIMRLYKAIFAFGWADDAVIEFLTQPDILPFLLVERPENCPPICRIGPEGKYNTLFTDTSQIGPYLTKSRVNNDRQDLEGLRFDSVVPKSGNPGHTFSTQFTLTSYHRWEYDPDSGRYLRFQETRGFLSWGKHYAPLIDSLTGEQLAADNVVVLRVPHEYFLKSTSTEIFDQPLNGSGTGYAFRDGQVYPIYWKYDPETQDMLELTLPNERLYPLKPGNVWFEIIGESSTMKPGVEDTWEIEFSIP